MEATTSSHACGRLRCGATPARRPCAPCSGRVGHRSRRPPLGCSRRCVRHGQKQRQARHCGSYSGATSGWCSPSMTLRSARSRMTSATNSSRRTSKASRSMRRSTISAAASHRAHPTANSPAGCGGKRASPVGVLCKWSRSRSTMSSPLTLHHRQGEQEPCKADLPTPQEQADDRSRRDDQGPGAVPLPAQFVTHDSPPWATTFTVMLCPEGSQYW